MKNLGVNNKKLKGKKRKTFAGMKDMFRSVAGVVVTNLASLNTMYTSVIL